MPSMCCVGATPYAWAVCKLTSFSPSSRHALLALRGFPGSLPQIGDCLLIDLESKKPSTFTPAQHGGESIHRGCQARAEQPKKALDSRTMSLCPIGQIQEIVAQPAIRWPKDADP